MKLEIDKKRELVTLMINVSLEYENDAGREHLIDSLKREVRIDMCGWAAGFYAMKSVEGSGGVVHRRMMEQLSELETT